MQKLEWFEKRLRQAVAESESSQRTCLTLEKRASDFQGLAESLQVQLAVEREALTENEAKVEELKKVCERERKKRRENERELTRLKEDGKLGKTEAQKRLQAKHKEVGNGETLKTLEKML